jgi:RHS repeat-associated protein
LYGMQIQIRSEFQSRSSGKERDSETGLDYFGARYYASNMGRWMSPDWSASPQPVPYADFSNPQSLNLYSYVSNNPLNKDDPDGHLASPWHFIITYAAAVATGHGPFHGIFKGFGKAAKNTWVDFRKGSQGTDAAHTNMHAMRGTNPDGSTQTAAEAKAATSQVINNAMQSGDTALAGHAAIDAATPAHDGQVWEGPHLDTKTVEHEIGDFLPSPSTIKQAFENEKSVLQGTNPIEPSPTPTPTPPPPPPPPPPPEPKHEQS